MSLTLSVFWGHGGDVYRHLATEELLLREVLPQRAFLYFWQSRDAVVIGKNQNPWRETWVPHLPQEDCALARRTSGGGAVFHDLGNLNVAFILPRQSYRRELVFEIFRRAVAAFGVPSHFIGRTNLGAYGRKMSGHAFALRAHGVLHHATLLIRCDKGKMQRVLRGRNSAMLTHAIASEPSEVINLSELVPEISTKDVAVAVEAAAQAVFSCTVAKSDDWPQQVHAHLDEIATSLASWDWIFGRTPPFEIRIRDTLADGAFSAHLRVEEGIVKQGEVSLTTSAHLSTSLTGTRFAQSELIIRMKQTGWSDLLAHLACQRLLTA